MNEQDLPPHLFIEKHAAFLYPTKNIKNFPEFSFSKFNTENTNE